MGLNIINVHGGLEMKRYTARLIKRLLHQSDKELLSTIYALTQELIRRCETLNIEDVFKMVLIIDTMQEGDS